MCNLGWKLLKQKKARDKHWRRQTCLWHPMTILSHACVEWMFLNFGHLFWWETSYLSPFMVENCGCSQAGVKRRCSREEPIAFAAFFHCLSTSLHIPSHSTLAGDRCLKIPEHLAGFVTPRVTFLRSSSPRHKLVDESIQPQINLPKSNIYYNCCGYQQKPIIKYD